MLSEKLKLNKKRDAIPYIRHSPVAIAALPTWT
jgi:hypothetical protein